MIARIVNKVQACYTCISSLFVLSSGTILCLFYTGFRVHTAVSSRRDTGSKCKFIFHLLFHLLRILPFLRPNKTNVEINTSLVGKKSCLFLQKFAEFSELWKMASIT